MNNDISRDEDLEKLLERFSVETHEYIMNKYKICPKVADNICTDMVKKINNTYKQAIIRCFFNDEHIPNKDKSFEAIMSDTTIESLNPTHKAARICAKHGILFVSDLLFLREVDLLRLPGLGRKSLRDLKEILKEKTPLAMGAFHDEEKAWRNRETGSFRMYLQAMRR